MRIKLAVITVIAACVAQVGVYEAMSCSVPVFRYALERWEPDPYKGIVIFDTEMSGDEQALFNQLKESARDPSFPLNLQIQVADKALVDIVELEETLKGGVPEKLPVIALWYPGEIGKKAPFYFGGFGPAAVNAITHSPKREELAKRLIRNDAVVWIFVPSGEKENDRQVEALLMKELDDAANRLAQSPKPVIPGYEGKTLSYDLSILPLSPTNPQEQFFVEMLLGSEPDLYEHQDTPMIFPVFGRGRLLGALFGEYITTDNIQGAISFMTGACSCEVKAMNPGTDLLIAAPWERAVLDIYASDEAIPELTGVMPDQPDTGKPDSQDSVDSGKTETLLWSYGIALVGVLVLVGLISMVVMRRTRRD